ncbi:hypothetical protein [uncultured Ruminococcus sp.]|uniref:hypothetical protein n=1 Tax=uncultured Ruminococcus sp. TaxID=165186 RepID=UPI0025E14417|nr:hypothetical protein [uncultured Ruminococcus sp.]
MMMVDVIEKNNIESSLQNISERISTLHKGFDSGITPEKGVYANPENTALTTSISENFGVANAEQAAMLKATAFQTVKGMYNGTDVNGNKGLGLNEISKWKVNENYEYSNLKQHAGYSAEVISTAKENMIAKAEGTGTVTYRVDDLPDSIRQQTGDKFALKNDQYADKLRIKADGTMETVQTKFVGKDASECYTKLKSSKYDKYVESNKVDKIEIAKDQYDGVKQNIQSDKIKLQKQLDKLSSNGETEKANSVQQKIDRLNKLDNKLEQSTVSSKEALFATEHPKLYSAKMLASNANKAGLQGAKQAAGLTFAVSSADNIYKYVNDEISGKEALTNIAKDTSIAGAVGYGSGVLREVTGSNIPAQVITLGVTSYDEVKDYVDGEIDGAELAHGLGRNVVQVVGGAAGATLGSAAGPVGSFAGGMAGSYAATQAYDAASEFISDNMDTIVETGAEVVDKVSNTVDNISNTVSDKLVEAKEATIEFKDNTVEKLGDIKDSAAEKLDDVKDGASEVLDDAKSMAVDLKDGAVKKFGAAKGKVLSKFRK